MTSMTNTDQANAYLRTKVMSASPAELRLMLLDGAIKFALQAQEGLETKNYEQSYAGFTQSRAIVLELATTIRPEPNPDLAERVKALYTFMYTELVESSMNKDVARLEKVIELLRYERETWVLLMEQIAKENASGAAAAPAAAGSGHAPMKIPAPFQMNADRPSGLSVQA
ncbi:MAG: flagellar export chaperone FliS [Phycisphaerae bacterium]|nr:flagellar export chaperone FliS [Phycisphaerae bacterium]